MNELKFCRVRDVKAPHRANHGDAGIDFFVPNDYQSRSIHPNGSVLIPAGVKVDVPEGWALVFFNKSGVASKKSLMVGACVIDHGYQGEVHINMINCSNEPQTISPGDKIVQGIMLQVGLPVPVETDIADMWTDTMSSRGSGGFGSTGTA